MTNGETDMSEKAKKSSRNHFLLVLLAVFAAVLTLQMGAGEVKAAAKGFRTVKGKTYYIDDSGKKHKGWLNLNGKKYYFTSDGTALKGMKKVDGKYYWFHTTDGYMFQNRRVTRKNGDIYYFGEDGTRCENGMYKITEKGAVHTYYFQKDGKAYKGWLTYKGNKYYFYKGSAALSGTRAENITLTSSGNLVSVFDKKGVCIKQYKK